MLFLSDLCWTLSRWLQASSVCHLRNRALRPRSHQRADHGPYQQCLFSLFRAQASRRWPRRLPMWLIPKSHVPILSSS
eukprot:13478_3